MIKFNQGDMVAIIENGELKKGIFKGEHFSNHSVAIVDFDGELKKVLVSDLAKITDDTNETVPEDNEPAEKAEITITPDEFRDITTTIIAKESHDMGPGGLYIGVIMASVMGKIHEALFNEAEND